MITANLKPKKPDFILSIPVVILLGFGMVMVYSTSGNISNDLYGDSGRIFTKQLIALLIGMPALVICSFIPHDIYRRKSIMYLAVLAVVVLLCGVLFQMEAKGASRWYYFSGFGFQPSVLATLVSILFVAAYATAFDRARDVWIRRLKVIGPFLLLICGMILAQNDFGTTMIILCITGIMLFLAGIPFRILALGGLVLLPIMLGLVLTKPYRIARIKSYLGEPHYQVVQSKLAIGSGGLTGVGLGQGKQKMNYLPEAHTDFIFASLGEEFGLMGCASLLACYLFFLGRGFLVLTRVESAYSRILGSGFLLLISLQAFLNISVALGLFPNKGLTLPFISAGGTSLIVSMAMFGILLNISRWQVQENRVIV